MTIKPTFAILDEIDSGLDIDALQVVAKGVNQMASPDFGVLMITHYQRLLNYIHPDQVHVMMGGKLLRLAMQRLQMSLNQPVTPAYETNLGLKLI